MSILETSTTAFSLPTPLNLSLGDRPGTRGCSANGCKDNPIQHYCRKRAGAVHHEIQRIERPPERRDAESLQNLCDRSGPEDERRLRLPTGHEAEVSLAQAKDEIHRKRDQNVRGVARIKPVRGPAQISAGPENMQRCDAEDHRQRYGPSASVPRACFYRHDLNPNAPEVRAFRPNGSDE